MIVLHAALCDDSILLWAESSEPRPPASRKRPPPAWFDAPAPDLLSTLRELGAGVSETTQAIAWLPSAAKRAIPSEAVIGDQPPAEQLAPWRVTAARLS